LTKRWPWARRPLSKDAYHRPHAPVITEQARAWVIHLACSKPKELGYAAELWTRSLLARHVRREAMQARHPSLSRAAKATVQRILAEQPLHPERVRSYLEKRDRAFEVRMKDVLLVYQEVALQNEAQRGAEGRPQSLPFQSMKSRDFRPSPTLRPICLRFPENIPMWSAITNINALGRVRSSRRWICTRVMSQLVLSGDIAAGNSSHCLRISTNTTRPAAPLESF
jgi:hypothetical protein